MSFVIGTIATAITFAVVSYVLPAIDYGGDVVNLLILSVIAGVINGLIKPIIKLFSLPLTMMTLGLFGIVINAGLLLLLAWVSGVVGIDFSVGGFPPTLDLESIGTAVIGAIAISIVGAIIGMVVHD